MTSRFFLIPVRGLQKNKSMFYGMPFLAAVLLLGICLGYSTASGYDDPLGRLSTEEREVLARAEGPQGQARACVRLAFERLRRAHEAVEHDDASSSDNNILVYDALLNELERVARDIPIRDKANKILEHALYEQYKSLESIRRETSALHTDPIDRALELVERIRHQTLNKMLGDGKLILREEGATKQP
jgi:hypothetical protein